MVQSLGCPRNCEQRACPNKPLGNWEGWDALRPVSQETCRRKRYSTTVRGVLVERKPVCGGAQKCVAIRV